MEKQVDISHYNFEEYMYKGRWISIWHQMDEVIKLKAKRVLEIGPGPGIFKLTLNQFNIRVETVDIDPELKPDYVASVTALPMENNKYDCVCAFQILEHLPYQDSLEAFREMVRVSNNNIIISLPDTKRIWRYRIPILKDIVFQLPLVLERQKVHKFDGQHYWEINRKGYSLKRVITDFKACNVQLISSYRVKENPYHRFFIFHKIVSK